MADTLQMICRGKVTHAEPVLVLRYLVDKLGIAEVCFVLFLCMGPLYKAQEQMK